MCACVCEIEREEQRERVCVCCGRDGMCAFEKRFRAIG